MEVGVRLARRLDMIFQEALCGHPGSRLLPRRLLFSLGFDTSNIQQARLRIHLSPSLRLASCGARGAIWWQTGSIEDRRSGSKEEQQKIADIGPGLRHRRRNVFRKS